MLREELGRQRTLKRMENKYSPNFDALNFFAAEIFVTDFSQVLEHCHILFSKDLLAINITGSTSNIFFL
jgi:hypothetical protein